jgi:glycerophosphoryl diester phosphodiesterase
MQQSLALSENRFLSLLRARKAHPVVIAHRGDSFHAPENTLEAARLAWRFGAAAWELDVRLTRDGVPIVIHDESLLCTTDVAKRFAGDPRAETGFRVSDFDLDEIKTLDAGSWFVADEGGPRSASAFGTLAALDPDDAEHFASGEVHVPTLEEALLFTKFQNWLVNVEIKPCPNEASGLLDRVLGEIAASRTAKRVLLSSFDHHVVADADRPGREYALGALTSGAFDPVVTRTGEPARIDTRHVGSRGLGSPAPGNRPQASTPDPPSLEAALDFLKSLGVPILVYTVNDHGTGSLAERLANFGVDALFTDDPHGMAHTFAAATIGGAASADRSASHRHG